jgi:putative endopeptidase
MRKILAGVACALLLAACGKSEAPPPAPAAAPPPPPPKVLVSGIDKSNFDPAVRPQDDLYKAINGAWLTKTEIPADKSNYGSFTQLDDAAEEQLKEIIEKAAAKPNKAAGSDEQKVGDFYTAFMDDKKADELGTKPVDAMLAKIDAIKSTAELPALLAEFLKEGVNGPLGGLVNQDAKDSTKYAVYFLQNGMIGMPDRDYYLSKDDKFAKLRAAYQAHVTNLLTMVGDKAAAANAKAVLAMETKIAEKHWTRVDSRDDEKTYNKYEVDKLNALTPGFDFAAFVKAGGVNDSTVIVAQPSAYTAFADQMAHQSLFTIKAYLKVQVLDSFAPLLSKPFVDEQFSFFGKTLRGIQENKPRWKRGVENTENALGEVLGRIYVAEHFPPEAKTRMTKLVANLLDSYKGSISQLDWMSDETKAKAQEKIAKFTPKIGYPNKWKDYSKLTVAADDLVGNVMRSSQVEYDRQIDKLGKPVDRDEWLMTPQTVNAYYNPGMNEIVFPAAILQPPFFDMNADDAVNYGGIGAVIGHEIGHGFDDQGSKYDGDGNLKSWWTDADRKAFETRTKALIEQYNHFCPSPGNCTNGALTIGENIGDLGGMTIAYKAYHASLGGKDGPVIDGMTADQRFFMGWAQVWRRKYRDEEITNRLKTDPHSLSEYRCNGIVANLPAFYTAFDVKETDKMFLAPEKRVKIW